MRLSWRRWRDEQPRAVLGTQLAAAIEAERRAAKRALPRLEMALQAVVAGRVTVIEGRRPTPPNTSGDAELANWFSGLFRAL